MHVCNDPKWLLNTIDITDVEVHARLVDGKKFRIESFRDVYLKFDKGSFIIRRVVCVIKLSMSVIFVANLHEEGCKVLFDDHVTIIRENITLCVGIKKQGLYELSSEPIGPRADKKTILEFEKMISKVKEDRNACMLHKRLAHMKLFKIHISMDSHYLFDIKIVKKLKCADCKRLKPHSCPLATNLERATKCMECVHMSIYDPRHIATWACQKVYDLFHG